MKHFKNEIQDTDFKVDLVDDLDIEQYEESVSSEEFYSSPEYLPPYLKNIIESEFEVSETEDIQPDLKLNTNTTNAPVTFVYDKSKKSLNVNRSKKQTANNKKLGRDKQVFCVYCETLVSNFPRHL